MMMAVDVEFQKRFAFWQRAASTAIPPVASRLLPTSALKMRHVRSGLIGREESLHRNTRAIFNNASVHREEVFA